MNETSQWLKVMLDEIERKRQEHTQAIREKARRRDETEIPVPKKSA